MRRFDTRYFGNDRRLRHAAKVGLSTWQYLFCLLTLAFGATLSAADNTTIIDSPTLEPLAVVHYRGVGQFNYQELYEDYADLLNLPLTQERQVQIVNRLAERYRHANTYPPNIRSSIPPSAPRVLVIEVIEPLLKTVRFSGFSAEERRRATSILRPFRQKSALQLGDLAKLESALERSFETPVQLQPAYEPDGLQLTIARQTQLQGSISFSTEGSSRLGRELGDIYLTYHPTSPYIERVFFATATTLQGNGYRRAMAGLDQPLSSDHQYLRYQLDWARATIEDDDLEYRRYGGSVGWHVKSPWSQRDLWRSLQQRLDLRDWEASMTFSIRDYTRNNEGIEDIDERLRMINGRLHGHLLSGQHSLYLIAQLRQGVDGLGAQREGAAADDDIDLDFTRMSLASIYRAQLPWQFTLRADLDAQYSPSTLPFSQRIALGRSSLLSAYDPGEVSGDSGLAGRFELRRGFDWYNMNDIRVVPYAYYGLGVVKVNEGNQRSGAATGLGVRAFTETVGSYLELGKPLTRDSSYKGDDFRVAGRLSYYF